MRILFGLFVGLVLGATGLAFAHGSPYGGGGGASLGLVDALYCKLTGCTMTGTLTGVTANLSGQVKSTLNPSGTGVTAASILANPTAAAADEKLLAAAVNDTAVWSVDNAGDLIITGDITDSSANVRVLDNLNVQDTDGSASESFVTSVDGNTVLNVRVGNSGGLAEFLMNGTAFLMGTTSGISNTSSSFNGTIHVNDSFRVASMWGAGVTAQTVTVASDGAGTRATGNVDPTSSTILVTCNDTDGCDLTMQETTVAGASGVGVGARACVINISANNVKFADVADVFAAPALVDTTGLALNDNFCMAYVDATNDLWVVTSSTDI